MASSAVGAGAASPVLRRSRLIDRITGARSPAHVALRAAVAQALPATARSFRRPQHVLVFPQRTHTDGSQPWVALALSWLIAIGFFVMQSQSGDGL